jgi:hypothetical protein
MLPGSVSGTLVRFRYPLVDVSQRGFKKLLVARIVCRFEVFDEARPGENQVLMLARVVDGLRGVSRGRILLFLAGIFHLLFDGFAFPASGHPIRRRKRISVIPAKRGIQT